MGLSSSPCNCQSSRSKCHSCPNGESAEEMTSRVDCVIRQVRSPSPPHDVRGGIVDFSSQQVREYHRKWKEEGQGTRDIMIVAHGHFNRCLIVRWLNFPLSEGACPKYET